MHLYKKPKKQGQLQKPQPSLFHRQKKSKKKGRFNGIAPKAATLFDEFGLEEPERKIPHVDDIRDIFSHEHATAFKEFKKRSTQHKTDEERLISFNEDLSFLGETYTYSMKAVERLQKMPERKSLKKAKNDARSNAIRRKKMKVMENRALKRENKERKKNRSIVTDHTPHDWAKVLQDAREKGYYDPRDTSHMRSKEKQAARLEVYREHKKRIMKENKRKAAERRRQENFAKKHPDLVARRARNAQNAASKKANKIARRKRRKERLKAAKPVPTESGVYFDDPFDTGDESPELEIKEEYVEEEEDMTLLYEEINEFISSITAACDNISLPNSTIDIGTFLIDTVGFVRMMYKAKDWESMVWNLNSYLAQIGIRRKVLEKASVLFKYLRAFFRERSGLLETESWSAPLVAMKNVMHLMVNSSLVKAIRDIVCTLLSFEVLGIEMPPEYANYFPVIDAKSTVTDVLIMLLDSFAVLTNVAERLWNGMPLCDAIFKGDPYAEFQREANWLLSRRDFLYRGVKLEGYYCYDDWITRLDKAIELGNSLKKNNFGKAKSAIVSRIEELQRAKLSVDNIMGFDRDMPAGFVLHGLPGQGKSYVNIHIQKLYAKVARSTYDPDMMYMKAPGNKYWDGYKPSQHPIIFISEAASQPEAVVKKQGDDCLAEVTRLMDRHRYNCTMASLDDKGKTFARPDLIIMETNKKDLNLDKGAVGNPNAIRRRFVWIEVATKSQFRKEGSNTADPYKIQELPPSQRMNIYTYKISWYKFVQNQPTEEFVHINDLLEFNEWITNHLVRHREAQQFSHESNDCAPLHGTSNLEEKQGLEAETEGGTIGKMAEAIDYMYFRPEDYPRPSAPLPVTQENTVGEWWFHVWLGKLMAFFSACFTNPVTFWLTLGRPVMFLASAWDIGVSMLWWFMVSKVLSVFLISPGIKKFFITLIITSLVPASILTVYMPFFSCISIFLVCLLSVFVVDPIAAGVDKSKRETAKLKARIRCAQNNFSQTLRCIGFDVAIGVSSLLLTIYALKSALKLYKRTTEKDTEASTIPLTPYLQDFEKSAHMGRGYARFKNKLQPHWQNAVVPTYNPPVHHGTLDDLTRTVSKNILFVLLEKDGKCVRKSHIFGLRSNIAIVNTHFIGTDFVNANLLVKTLAGNSADGFIKIPLSNGSVYHVGDDISLVRISSMQFRDVTKHVVDSTQMPDHIYGQIEEEKSRAELVENIKLTDKYNGNSTVARALQYDYKDHGPGKCGIPYLVKMGNGVAIGAVHCAGAEGKGYGVLLNAETLDENITAFEKELGLMSLHSECSNTNEYELPLPKSMMRFMTLTGADYMGKAQGPVMVNKKSSLTPSVLRKKGVLDDLFYTEFGHVRSTVFAPPVMAPKTIGGRYISPWNLGMEKINSVSPALDPAIMKIVVNRLTSHILSSLPEETKIQPIDFEVAINGVPDDPFISRINASTSGGLGFPGAKRVHLPLKFGETRGMTAELKRSLESDCKHLSEGRVPFWCYKYALKDEPRSIDKVKQGKTRLFGVPPLDKLILDRAFLSPFYSLVVEHCEVFGSAVGIDAHKGFGRIRELLAIHGNIMEADYSAFDQSMACDVAHMDATVVCNVVSALGYSEFATNIVRGLMTSNMFVYAELLKDVIMKPGLQPSGKYATAEDNSVRNLLMLMYAWYATPALADKDFFEFVIAVTYGDDLLASVAEDVKHLFNNLTYKDFCAKHYNMKVTPASKDDEMKEFVSIDDMSFLKRRFVWSKRFQSWAGVLELDSCYKALEWRIPSKMVSDEDQMISTVFSVLWEVFVRCRDDEATFTSFRSKIIKYLYEESYGDLNSLLPTFGDIAGKLYPEVMSAPAL